MINGLINHTKLKCN